MRALAFLLLLGLPTLAAADDLSGTWSGTITIVGTRLQSSYSPITGVTLTPVPDVQVMPSPFGPLILSGDGSYTMPVMGYSGDWAADPAMVLFTGPLSASPALVEWLDTGPVLTLTLRGSDGAGETVTFARVAD